MRVKRLGRPGGTRGDIAWECLATGRCDLARLPRVGLGRRAEAAVTYLRACRIYARRGLPGARDYLSSLQERFAALPLATTEDAVRLVRRSTAPLRVVGRCVREDALCLPRSVSLAAAMIRLGLPAQVVIGRARCYTSPRFDFHAWVEIAGVPVSDPPRVQRVYSVVWRYPEWRTPVPFGECRAREGGERGMVTEVPAGVTGECSAATDAAGKLPYEPPALRPLGRAEELTGSTGSCVEDTFGLAPSDPQ